MFKQEDPYFVNQLREIKFLINYKMCYFQSITKIEIGN